MPRRSDAPSISLQQHLEALAAARQRCDEQLDIERERRYTQRWESSERAITAAQAATEKSATMAERKDRRMSDQVTLIADIQNRGTGRSSGTAQGWAYFAIGASLLLAVAGLLVAVFR